MKNTNPDEFLGISSSGASAEERQDTVTAPPGAGVASGSTSAGTSSSNSATPPEKDALGAVKSMTANPPLIQPVGVSLGKVALGGIAGLVALVAIVILVIGFLAHSAHRDKLEFEHRQSLRAEQQEREKREEDRQREDRQRADQQDRDRREAERQREERQRAEQQERERREAAMQRQRAEDDRLQLAEKRNSLAHRYAHNAGEQVMGQVGGGQDLIVKVSEARFDGFSKLFKIEMSIQFNGAIFRSNTYLVEGVLTVDEDGSNARFARTYSNDQFKKVESRLKWTLGVAAGVFVLNELSK